MSLVQRQADLGTCIADLRALIAACDVDILAADPDRDAINRIREEAAAAMAGLGFSSGEPQ